jgi:hypothetical protein
MKGEKMKTESHVVLKHLVSFFKIRTAIFIAVMCMFVLSGTAVAVTYTDSAPQSTAGQNFTFTFHPVESSVGMDGTFTVHARGDYTIGYPSAEYLTWNIEGLVSGTGAPAYGTIIHEFKSDDVEWEQSYTISGSTLDTITADSSITIFVDLSSEVNYQINPSLHFVEVELTYESTCLPPDAPNNPDPCDGAADVPIDTYLSWNGGDGGKPGTCVVVPNANTFVEGNRNNGYPFHLVSSMRYQQIYDAAEVGQSGVITEIRLRPDADFGDPFSSANMTVEIFLGYAATSVLAPSGTFANNIGPGYVKVYDGILTLSSNDVGGPPRNFDVIVNVDDIFEYDPANGPLLLDVKLYSSSGSTFFDAVGFGVQTATTRIYSSSVGSPTGTIHFDGSGPPYGLVTMFCFNGAVPKMQSLNKVTSVNVRDPNTYEVDLETGTVVDSAASQEANNKLLDDMGNQTGSKAQFSLCTFQTAAPSDVLIFRPHINTNSRLAGLGYNVTATANAGDLTRANLQGYCALWIDVGVNPSDYASQASEIRDWVSFDGGGLLVVQPSITGANVSVFPPGYEVTIFNTWWPGNENATIVYPSHPMVFGLSNAALSGNFDWVRSQDIGNLWDIIAVDAETPSDIALLAGGFGNGRLAFCTGNFGAISADPGSDQFVVQMVDWLCSGPVAPPCAITYDVYLGTDPCSLELIPECNDICEPNCDPTPGPGDLNECTTYYWQVVAKNRCGTTAGDIWSFKTEGICNQDPNCSFATPSIQELWPPNHRWVDIEILDVNDPDGDPVTITITAVTQDEPPAGKGSGRTFPDGDGIGTSTARLRAERSGEGNGRVYEISFEADDGKGGICSGSVSVCVPHDMGSPDAEGQCDAIDDGQLYDSAASELLRADINRDGIVNMLDMEILTDYWLISYEFYE